MDGRRRLLAQRKRHLPLLLGEVALFVQLDEDQHSDGLALVHQRHGEMSPLAVLQHGPAVGLVQHATRELLFNDDPRLEGRAVGREIGQGVGLSDPRRRILLVAALVVGGDDDGVL